LAEPERYSAAGQVLLHGQFPRKLAQTKPVGVCITEKTDPIQARNAGRRIKTLVATILRGLVLGIQINLAGQEAKLGTRHTKHFQYESFDFFDPNFLGPFAIKLPCPFVAKDRRWKAGCGRMGQIPHLTAHVNWTTLLIEELAMWFDQPLDRFANVVRIERS